MHRTLTINEIFYSVQGEAAFSGYPCVFVRLTGCPLRCSWCDTTYAYEEGTLHSVAEIITKVEAFHNPFKIVELTGGEPLIQSASTTLVDQLVARGYKVLIETSGSVSIAEVVHSAHIIMDLKCPTSGMQQHNALQNLDLIKPSDEIKFVIADHADFIWAVDMVKKHHLESRVQLIISPVFGRISAQKLVEWVLTSGIKFRINLQIHKFIWEPTTRGV